MKSDRLYGCSLHAAGAGRRANQIQKMVAGDLGNTTWAADTCPRGATCTTDGSNYALQKGEPSVTINTDEGCFSAQAVSMTTLAGKDITFSGLSFDTEFRVPPGKISLTGACGPRRDTKSRLISEKERQVRRYSFALARSRLQPRGSGTCYRPRPLFDGQSGILAPNARREPCLLHRTHNCGLRRSRNGAARVALKPHM